MKTITQTILLMLMTAASYGQDLTGHWNGALNVQGTQLRVIIHVTKSANQYEATLDSPDQNVSGIKVTTANFSYPNVKFEISNMGVVYEGVMSDQGITGKWSQSGTSLFLVLSKPEDPSTENKKKNK
jgi:hypothetical protein